MRAEAVADSPLGSVQLQQPSRPSPLRSSRHCGCWKSRSTGSLLTKGCAFGDFFLSKEKPYYGLVVKGKGKKKKYTCVQCPKGCMFCDGGKCRDESPDDNE